MQLQNHIDRGHLMKRILIVLTMLLFASTAMAADISEETVKRFFSDWLAAQNNGAFSRYADMYSQNFVGIRRSGKSTRKFDYDAWLKDRKKMFKKTMLVVANSTEIYISGNTASVKFEQTWESGAYKDKGNKLLNLALENGNLRIIREEMLSSVLDIKFSSSFTSFKKNCRDKFSELDEGQDMPQVCIGPSHYKIEVSYSACCEYLQIINKNFTVELPRQMISTVDNRILEWRLANGKPFAIILKLDKYRGDLALDGTKIKEVLLIKGLNGFDDINHEIDTERKPNSIQEARRLADQSYMRLLEK